MDRIFFIIYLYQSLNQDKFVVCDELRTRPNFQTNFPESDNRYTKRPLNPTIINNQTSLE
jgi:hypothetical protein